MAKWSTHSGPTWQSETRKFQEIIATGMFEGEPYKVAQGGDGNYMPDFADRVRAGMDLLDKINPGWQDTLDLQKLDLESEQMCVLGQTWPHYARVRGLVEQVDSGDFKDFAASLAVGDITPIDTAVAIGCALGDADFAVINATAYEAGGHNSDKAHDLAMESTRRFWEHLTKTWIREIQKARAEGRWDDAASSASAHEEASASTAESTSSSPSEQMASSSS